MFAQRAAWILIGLMYIASVGACSQVPTSPEGESAGKEVIPSSENEDAEYESIPAPENSSVMEDITLAPDEIIHIKGEGSYRSEPFVLEGHGIIKMYWRQESSEFILSMVSTDEELAQAPMGRVTFEVALAPSQYVDDSPYVVPVEYVVGEYVIDIIADGPWEVWAKVVYPEGE